MDEPLQATTAEGSPLKKAILLLCLPSWVSGLLCVVIALSIVATIIGMVHYQGSSVQQEFLAWRTKPVTAADIDRAEFTTTAAQATTNTIFTFIFWSFIGLSGYYVAYGIYDFFHTLESLKKELHYVHADRQQLLRDTVLRIGVRFAVLAAWFGYFIFFLNVVVPHSLDMAHTAAGQITSLTGILAALAATCVLFVALHVHLILLRLLLLRPRVFHGETYL